VSRKIKNTTQAKLEYIGGPCKAGRD
jgi:hypothetical protein